ncbi:3'(2'),5'-bisphosphate nucleotidase CysQ [subsurface metagenome]
MDKIKLGKILTIALEAGKEIIKVYNSDFQTGQKEDNSPITLADKKSHDIICNELKKLTPNIPVLSEEGEGIPYEKRKEWEYFWLIDPLDGTKDFVKRNGEFTVNIALIEKDTPILGVIYAPEKQLLYFASKDKGAYKLNNVENLKSFHNFDELATKALKLPLECEKQRFTIIASRSHMNKKNRIIHK